MTLIKSLVKLETYRREQFSYFFLIRKNVMNMPEKRVCTCKLTPYLLEQAPLSIKRRPRINRDFKIQDATALRRGRK